MENIDLLEKKIKKVVDMMKALKEENWKLEERLAEKDKEFLRLEEEQKAVRSRIEKILGELEIMEPQKGRLSD
ncbi:MAG: cell division protein ZapB [Nitrospirae bacterium]|nr:cell division protein ZapB [Nitrospirota bacterium]